jgi:hypothetical protein
VSLLHKIPLDEQVLRVRQECAAVGLDCPDGSLQELVGADRLGNRVNYPGVCGTEITCHVAAVLLQSTVHRGYFKITNLVVRGNEVVTQVFADAGI